MHNTVSTVEPEKDVPIIEGHIDIEDARKALEDPDEKIPSHELWKALGL